MLRTWQLVSWRWGATGTEQIQAEDVGMAVSSGTLHTQQRTVQPERPIMPLLGNKVLYWKKKLHTADNFKKKITE